MRACGSLSAAVRASGFLSTTPNHYGRLICAHAVLVERAALFGRFRSAPANDSIDMQYTPESEPGRSRQGRAQREVYTLKPSEGILVEGSDEPVRSYVECTQRVCEENGVSFRLHETSHSDVSDTLRRASEDPLIHGIMIYYPFFKSAVSTTHGEGVQGDRQDLLDTTGEMQVGGVRQAVAEHARGAAGARAVDVEEEDWGRSALHIKTLSDHVRHHKTLSLSDDVLRNAVPVRKDVEALSCWYQDALYHNIRTLSMLPADERPPPAPGSKCLVPCAPLAVVKILEHLAIYDPQLPTGQGLAGKTVAILNRSRVVGQPLGAMLANDGAVVFSMDEDSVFRHSRSASDLDRSVTPQGAVAGADVVILGVSSPSFRMPCEWVAPGTLVINVAAQPNVDEHALLQVPGVTYVPKIGQMTVAMLQRNLVRLIENFHLPPGLT